MKLVEDQLTEERSTKSSVEARAIGVVTSSGALATLLFALGALVTEADDFRLPDSARVVLVLTLGAFIVAAILALFAARPGTYQEVSLGSLRDAATPEAMGASADEGSSSIANVLIAIIAKARESNATKASFLKYAVTFEAGARLARHRGGRGAPARLSGLATGCPACTGGFLIRQPGLMRLEQRRRPRG